MTRHGPRGKTFLPGRTDADRYPDRTDQFFEEATAGDTSPTEPIETRRARRDLTE